VLTAAAAAAAAAARSIGASGACQQRDGGSAWCAQLVASTEQRTPCGVGLPDGLGQPSAAKRVDGRAEELDIEEEVQLSALEL
jgi:hypothetical protein